MAGFSIVMMLLVFFVILGALLLYLAATYVISSVTVWKISKKLGIKKGWLAFIPMANYYQLGRLAQEDDARRRPDKKPVKWGVIYLVTGIIYIVGITAIAVVREVLSLVMMGAGSMAGSGDYSAFPSIEQWDGSMVIEMLFQSAIWVMAIAMSIFAYAIIYKIYHVMAGDSATWMLALTIFAPLSQLVLFLILAFSKKYPKPIPVPPSMDYQGYPEEGAVAYPQPSVQEATEETTNAVTADTREPALPQTAQEQIGVEE